MHSTVAVRASHLSCTDKSIQYVFGGGGGRRSYCCTAFRTVYTVHSAEITATVYIYTVYIYIYMCILSHHSFVIL